MIRRTIAMPSLPAVERQRRLVPAFGRQAPHPLGIDVGRIGNDEVVALALQRREQIALYEPYAALHAMQRDVLAGNSKRILGQVGGIDLGIRKPHRGEDREAA